MAAASFFASQSKKDTANSATALSLAPSMKKTPQRRHALIQKDLGNLLLTHGFKEIIPDFLTVVARAVTIGRII